MAERRRGPGEGSIYQDKSTGRWVGAADLGWVDGRRVRRKVTGAKYEDVRRRLRKLQNTVESGVVPDGAKLSEWLAYWLDKIAAKKLRPKTLGEYRGYINRYILPTIGHFKLSKLTPDHVRGMHAWMEQKKLSPATIRQAHAILQRSLQVALGEGKVERNVAQIAGAVSPARNPHPIMSVEEALQVLRAAKDDTRLRARLAVALMAGMRQGEALGLQWADVKLDGDHGAAYVHQVVQQIPGRGLVIGPPKTKSSVRSVPLIDVPTLALAAWRKESGGRGYVFHGHSGPMTPEGPRRDHEAWKRALVAAGVRHIPLHGARGSTASILQAKGVPPRVIADILGHSTAQVTTDHYLHSDDAQRVAAMRAGFGDWRELLELES